MLLLKFERIGLLAKWPGARLAEIVAQNGEALAADVVVPVPLHRDQEKEPGYNQAELTASEAFATAASRRFAGSHTPKPARQVFV